MSFPLFSCRCPTNGPVGGCAANYYWNDTNCVCRLNCSAQPCEHPAHIWDYSICACRCPLPDGPAGGRIYSLIAKKNQILYDFS